MKKYILALLSSLAITAGAYAHGEVELGPNGGRLVPFGEHDSLHAEVVLKDGKFVVGLYDEEKKKEVPVAGQVLTVTHKEKNAKLTPTLEGGKWSIAKPDGDEFWLIMTLKADAAGKAKSGRLHYDAKVCGDCKSPEWVCKCSEGKEKGKK